MCKAVFSPDLRIVKLAYYCIVVLVAWKRWDRFNYNLLPAKQALADNPNAGQVIRNAARVLACNEPDQWEGALKAVERVIRSSIIIIPKSEMNETPVKTSSKR